MGSKAKLTPDILAAELIARFGYAVLPTRTDQGPGLYFAGQEVSELWSGAVAGRYEIAGRATGRDWDRQAKYINELHPGFLTPAQAKAEGYRVFWKVKNA